MEIFHYCSRFCRRSYDPSLSDEGYQAYVFDTDKGTFEISVAEGSSNKTHFSTDQIFRKVIKLNECLIKTRETLVSLY